MTNNFLRGEMKCRSFTTTRKSLSEEGNCYK